MRTRQEDFLTQLFVASTHAYILIFSDRGRVYWLKVHEIPDVGPAGRGKAIANLVRMAEGERVAALLAVREFPETDKERFVVMGTRRGVVKKTDLRAYRHPRADGIIAIGVEADDSVMGAELLEGDDEIFIGTRAGMAIRFKGSGVRAMGRTARGVRGIALRTDDEVVAMTVVRPEGTLLTVTERGYGKRTAVDAYRLQARGGLGLINIQTSERNGRVTGVEYVEQDDELMLITQDGKILRMVAKGIRPIGRATQGVRLIEIDGDDRVVSLARLADQELTEQATDDEVETSDTEDGGPVEG
jgi:DNA gyrase subunit A